MDWTILRYFTLVTAVIEGGLFSGCILGWSSLAFILKSEGFFRSGCNDTTSNANLQDDTSYTRASNLFSEKQCYK